MDISLRNKFFEKAVFLEKTAKNPFVGEHDPFENKCSFKKKFKIIDLNRFLSIKKTKKLSFIDHENYRFLTALFQIFRQKDEFHKFIKLSMYSFGLISVCNGDFLCPFI